MSLHHYSDRVFAIADFLSLSECQALIDLAESQGFAAATVRTQQGPQMLSNIRNNQRTILPSARLGWRNCGRAYKATHFRC